MVGDVFVEQQPGLQGSQGNGLTSACQTDANAGKRSEPAGLQSRGGQGAESRTGTLARFRHERYAGDVLGGQDFRERKYHSRKEQHTVHKDPAASAQKPGKVTKRDCAIIISTDGCREDAGHVQI